MEFVQKVIHTMGTMEIYIHLMGTLWIFNHITGIIINAMGTQWFGKLVIVIHMIVIYIMEIVGIVFHIIGTMRNA
jgi:hypothetical protein